MLGVAPSDLVATVPLTSNTATLDFQEVSWTELAVYSPDKKEVPVSTDLVVTGKLRQTFTFLTESDGIYVVQGVDDSFCIPILGRLYACRNKLVLDMECCDCHSELDKSLRTLDVLLRCIVALANVGKAVEAQKLYKMASTLCEPCNCGCHA